MGFFVAWSADEDLRATAPEFTGYRHHTHQGPKTLQNEHPRQSFEEHCLLLSSSVLLRHFSPHVHSWCLHIS